MKAFAIGATLTLGLASGASAMSVDVDVFGLFDGTTSTEYADAKTAEANFLAGYDPTRFTTEDFESYLITPVGDNMTSLSTSVGVFNQVTQGNIADGLRILRGPAIAPDPGSPFNGRRDMTAATFRPEKNVNNTGKWLDSNDSRVVGWSLVPILPLSAIGFFLTDISDVSAKLSVTFTDGTTTVLDELISEPKFPDGTDVPNGQVVYVTARFFKPVDMITFTVSTGNDGWGIDNVTAVAPIPLPMGAWFALTALAGAVALRRRKVAQAA